MACTPGLSGVLMCATMCCCRELKKLPFFIYSWVDEDIAVARGRSGGLALWVRADDEWQAKTGVLQVYK